MNKQSVAGLRTECNRRGLSCRDKSGKYLTISQLKSRLQVGGNSNEYILVCIANYGDDQVVFRQLSRDELINEIIIDGPRDEWDDEEREMEQEIIDIWGDDEATDAFLRDIEMVVFYGYAEVNEQLALFAPIGGRPVIKSAGDVTDEDLERAQELVDDDDSLLVTVHAELDTPVARAAITYISP